MSGKRHNKKLPKDGVSDSKVEPKYGYVFGEWDSCGGHNWVYRNPDDDKTFSSKLTPSCNYTTTEYDDNDKEITSSLNPGEYRHYVGGGLSFHSDSHYDVNSEGTHRTESHGDMAHACKTNYLRGCGGKEVKIKGCEAKVIAQQSGGVSRNGYSATKSEQFGSSLYQHVQEDHVAMVEANKGVVVKKDYGINTKNYDLYVNNKGKVETKQSFLVKTGANATINSASNFVTLSSSDTKMTSKAKFDVKASENITISSDADVSANGQNITIEGKSKITIKVGGASITI